MAEGRVKLTRESYLDCFWRPYPKALPGWLDVRAFLRSMQGARLSNQSTREPLGQATGQVIGQAQIVCGRLGRSSDGRWALSSDGQSLVFSFAPAAFWNESGSLVEPGTHHRSTVAFADELLAPGDLVAIELNSYPLESEAFVASSCLLLAPARAPYAAPSARFDVDRSRLYAEFINEVRGFFRSRDFVEAATPTLVPSPGTEPFLDPFATEWEYGSNARQFFLPTSPEFHLKKMLVLGWTKVFEFKTCFRNGEISEHHQPEFTMLEWYRAYSDLDAIADDVQDLLASLVAKFFPERAENPAKAVPTLARTTMAELFAAEFSGFQLTPQTTREELVALAEREGIAVASDDRWDDVFFRLFLERIEHRLGVDGPLLVRGYPPSQAALSRIGESGFADRFEVYWRGLELANAFHELNDPKENEDRFRSDAQAKKDLGKRPVPVDEALVRALYQGMPPSGGIALGIDRLFMALFGIGAIAETRAFPLSPEDAEKA